MRGCAAMWFRRPSPAPRAIVLSACVLVLVTVGCSRSDPDRGRAGRDAAGGEGAVSGGGGEAEGDDIPSGPTTTLPGPFGAIPPAPPEPTGEAEVTLSGAISAKVTAEPRVRCVSGDGFFDVVMSFDAEPPRIGDGATLVSLSFGAPSYRRPGRYDIDPDGGAYAVLVDDGEGPVDFVPPDDGAVEGVVEIRRDARSGTFDLRGLVDADARPLDVRGEFTCGEFETL